MELKQSTKDRPSVFVTTDNRPLYICYVTYTCIEILSGAMRGAGEAMAPTLMTLFGVCALRLIWLLVFVARDPTIPRAMFSYPMTWTVTSCLFILYYWKGGWMKRCQERLITRRGK